MFDIFSPDEQQMTEVRSSFWSPPPILPSPLWTGGRPRGPCPHCSPSGGWFHAVKLRHTSLFYFISVHIPGSSLFSSSSQPSPPSTPPPAGFRVPQRRSVFENKLSLKLLSSLRMQTLWFLQVLRRKLQCFSSVF